MIFQPTRQEKTQTKILPGDLICVSKKGDVLVMRIVEERFIPLIFADFPGISGSWITIATHDREVKHEYAWWIATSVASIAGLFVEDSYTLSHEGHHQFPVTDIQPAPIPPNV